MAASAPPRASEDDRFAPLVDAVLTAAARETRWRRALLAMIAPRHGELIVELGAGPGAMAHMIADANPAASVLVIDEDAEALAREDARAREAGRRIAFMRGAARDVQALTARRAPAKIVASLALTRASAREKFVILDAAHRSLREDGAIYCAEFGAQTTPLMRALFRAFHETPAPEHGALARTMREAGFKAVDEPSRFETVTGAIALYSARVR